MLKLAAKLHGKPPNDLASEEVTVHRKMIRVRNAAIGILISLLLVSMFLFYRADEQRKAADIETQKSQSLLLSAIAEEQLDKNPTLSIRLAELAWQKSPTHPPSFLVQRIVFKGFYEPLENKSLFYKNNLVHEGVVTSAEFSPDGKRIVTASGDKYSQDMGC